MEQIVDTHPIFQKHTEESESFSNKEQYGRDGFRHDSLIMVMVLYQ